MIIEVFKYIIILCPTIQWNKAYKNREWIGDVKKPKKQKYYYCKSSNQR